MAQFAIWFHEKPIFRGKSYRLDDARVFKQVVGQNDLKADYENFELKYELWSFPGATSRFRILQHDRVLVHEDGPKKQWFF